MSHNPPSPSAALAPSLTGADPALVRACLLNVAEALNLTMLPELSGGARARAGECATILQRAVQSLGPVDGAVAAELSRLAQYARPLPAEQWRAAAELEGAALDQSEAAIAAAGQPAGAAASRTFVPERLESYLRGHALGGAALRVTGSRVLSGGRSKQTILVQLEGAKTLPATVVVRQDWSSAVTGTS
ncbi:MAG TPA: hypothetical protein VNX47_14200, partial [Nevskia sp.]|nr:hypothetical protein [Nevskia sp.]